MTEIGPFVLLPLSAGWVAGCIVDHLFVIVDSKRSVFIPPLFGAVVCALMTYAIVSMSLLLTVPPLPVENKLYLLATGLMANGASAVLYFLASLAARRFERRRAGRWFRRAIVALSVAGLFCASLFSIGPIFAAGKFRAERTTLAATGKLGDCLERQDNVECVKEMAKNAAAKGNSNFCETLDVTYKPEKDFSLEAACWASFPERPEHRALCDSLAKAQDAWALKESGCGKY